jgi:hypothetical protein
LPHPQLERRAQRHEAQIERVRGVVPVGFQLAGQQARARVQFGGCGGVRKQKIQSRQCVAGETGTEAADRGRKNGIVRRHEGILAEAFTIKR